MGRRGFVWVGLALLTLGGTSSCAVAIGLAAAGAVATTVALTAGCYDIVDVNVVDANTGLPRCDASVVARKKNGSESRFSSCFHAELNEGTWTILAQRPGFRPATTEMVVGGGRSCQPAVQTIELRLWPVDRAAPAPIPIRPPRPGEAPLTPGSLPAPGGLDGTPPAEPAPPRGSTPPITPPPSSTGSFDEPPMAPGTAPAPSSSASPAPSGSASTPSVPPR